MTSNLTSKSSCQKYGHIWISTTSPTVQLCHRCHAMRHFTLDGEWHMDEQHARVVVADPDRQQLTQHTLF